MRFRIFEISFRILLKIISKVRVVRHSNAGQSVVDMMKPCRSSEKLGEQPGDAGGAGGGN